MLLWSLALMTLATASTRPAATTASGESMLLPFAELARMVDASLCARRSTPNGPCVPERVTVPATGGGTLVFECPGCLQALVVDGTHAQGRLVSLSDAGPREVAFRTEAATADEMARLAGRLETHFDERYFDQARRPRGLLADENEDLIVADLGTGNADGRIWWVQSSPLPGVRVTPAAGTVVEDHLPSVLVNASLQGQRFPSIVGISSVRRAGGRLLGLVNRVVGKGRELPELKDVPLASLLWINPGAGPGEASAATAEPRRWTAIASLFEFEARHNPDQDGIESNPFDVAVRNGHAYVADAAANAVLRVDERTGATTLYAVFEEVRNLLSPQVGFPTVDAVPTGLEFGPDGALYVAYLSGFPFGRGNAGVVRLVDLNGDSDALDTGEKTEVVTGLTMAIDVTFDRGGTMYTAEHSLEFMKRGPGRLCMIEDGRCAVTLTDHAAGPTSIAVAGGYLYYAQELQGRVGRVRLPSAKKLGSIGPGPK